MEKTAKDKRLRAISQIGREVDRGSAAPNKKLVKIVFKLEDSDWHDFKRELMWATQLDDHTYRLENSPFYAFGVSWQDIVRAKSMRGRLMFQEVVERGGHSTYRFILNEGVTLRSRRFQKYWKLLKELGCTYEDIDEHLFSVDVPPQADIYDVYNVLASGEKAGIWDFQEGHCGHPLKEKR